MPYCPSCSSQSRSPPSTLSTSSLTHGKPHLGVFVAHKVQRLPLNDSLLRLCALQDSIFVPRGRSSRKKQTTCDDGARQRLYRYEASRWWSAWNLESFGLDRAPAGEVPPNGKVRLPYTAQNW